MFADFLKKLMGAGPGEMPEIEGRLALSALLVRVARSDGDYAKSEAALIEALLAERYGLDEAAAHGLRREAEALEGEAPDTVRFTRAIKAAVPYEEREGVIEALWAVVLEDGVRDHEEDAMLRLVANLLGVNDRDSALARQRVQTRSA